MRKGRPAARARSAGGAPRPYICASWARWRWGSPSASRSASRRRRSKRRPSSCCAILGALAPPLILLAIVQALMRAQLGGRQALRLVGAAADQHAGGDRHRPPGRQRDSTRAWTKAAPGPEPAKAASAADPLTQFFDSVPKSILGPFADNGKVMGVIFLAVALGIALRGLRHHEVRTVEDLVHVALTSLITFCIGSSTWCRWPCSASWPASSA